MLRCLHRIICDSSKLTQLNTLSATKKVNLDIENKLHLKMAEAITKFKQKYDMRAKDGTVTCITFDFMQNLPLPYMKSKTVYYSKQLWYVYGVHNLADDSAPMYHYLEHEETQKCNELDLISNGCPGQNNLTIVVLIYTHMGRIICTTL
ncbi:hypothetical protein PR048_028506 [Dryococelus australis]|uniref:Uncharacterized protein n=1 Tax=Dryococelus australis TaxID=614101 RepID=A0ABQ9GAR4_9NEOP|nr:hypothetical protein PR048_028506 [Dryococelus australis]